MNAQKILFGELRRLLTNFDNTVDYSHDFDLSLSVRDGKVIDVVLTPKWQFSPKPEGPEGFYWPEAEDKHLRRIPPQVVEKPRTRAFHEPTQLNWTVEQEQIIAKALRDGIIASHGKEEVAPATLAYLEAEAAKAEEEEMVAAAGEKIAAEDPRPKRQRKVTNA